MDTLDNRAKLRRYNRSHVADSLANFPSQLEASWKAAKKLSLPKNCRKFDNLIFCGMGGSNLASELARAVFAAEISKPVAIVRGYDLPAYAGRDTLVIITSYSGNTEEAISCLRQARKARAKIICLASGGRLAKEAKAAKLPLYEIDKSLNPSNQPRYDVGSQLGATLGILRRLRLIDVSDQTIKKIIAYSRQLGQKLIFSVPLEANPAKQLALELADKIVAVAGAGHLSANAHILSNQINESAKQLAVHFKIPELNHHLLEGLSFPRDARKQLLFLFLESPFYDRTIAKRFAVTRKVLSVNKISSLTFKARGRTPLESAVETLVFGGWASYYLAVINRQDPAEIPWVNYFKNELSKK